MLKIPLYGTATTPSSGVYKPSAVWTLRMSGEAGGGESQKEDSAHQSERDGVRAVGRT